MYKLEGIRQLFLDYFIKNNHQEVKSSSLLPHNDNSLLFTNAGMVQFKNIFLGLEETNYQKAVSSQKCLRAGGKHNDLDNVGYTSRHHTFFEMLGNFSFGDYFKEQAIYYAFDFIHKVLEIPKEKLLVTVYHDDDEAISYWKKIAGFSDDKIIRIATSDNFWSMGDVGPCGPCTEIFYDYGETIKGGPPGSYDENGDRFTEIWNLVFMQYNQTANGEQIKFKKPSIDTGMGLERIASVLQGVTDNYDIDLFKNIINNTEELIKTKVSAANKPSFKVIADHIRAVTFMISDGVLPSNEGRGYVLRRIIRRAVRHGYLLNNKEPIFYKLVPEIVKLMSNAYPEIEHSQNLVVSTLKSEEEKFGTTVHDGMKLLNESMTMVKNQVLPGDIAFKLYDTFGFPLDLTEDILKQQNISVNLSQFKASMQEQKTKSKKSWGGSGENKDNDYWFNLANVIETQFVGYEHLTASSNVIKIIDYDLNEKNSIGVAEQAFLITSVTPFYAESGGQVGDTGFINNKNFTAKVIDTQKFAGKLFVHKVEVTSGFLTVNDTVTLEVNEVLRKEAAASHTGTHLLYASIAKVTGIEVTQQGSLVEPKRLRSDVFLNKALSKEEIIQIEQEVNRVILQNLPVSIAFMPYQEAIDKGAKFLLGEKYPSEVRVVSIGDTVIYSSEMCGGTHVKSTGEIGLLKITSESGIKAGVRRIEAITNRYSLTAFQELERAMDVIYEATSSTPNNIELKINNLINDNKQLKIELANLRDANLLNSLNNQPQVINGINFINIVVPEIILNDLKNLKSLVLGKYNPAILLFTNHAKSPSSFLATIDNNLSSKLNLSNLMQHLQLEVGAKGGGNNLLVQGKVLNSNVNLVETITSWLTETTK